MDITELTEDFFQLERGSLTQKHQDEKDALGEEEDVVDPDNMTPEQQAEYDYSSRYYELGRLLNKASEKLIFDVVRDLSPDARGKLWRSLEEHLAD